MLRHSDSLSMPAPDLQEPSTPTKSRSRLVHYRSALGDGVRAIVVYAVLASTLLGYDGFGFSAATDTSDLVQQILASKYDRDSERRDAAQRPVVVLVTDETLRHPAFELEASGWPPTFDLHAKVLRRILEEKPSLLFIDVLFRDKRGDEAALRGALEAYAKGGPPIPVLVAAGSACPPDAEDHGRRRAEQLVEPFAERTWPIAVPALLDGDDNASRQYMLWQTSEPRSGCPTAALAMHWALQIGAAWAGSPVARPLGSAHLRATVNGTAGGNPFLEPLEIFWGARRNATGPGRPPAENDADGGSGDDTPSECGTYLPASPFEAALVRLAGHDLRQQCPYIETIHAEDLMVEPPGAMLRGRPVLYGLSFVGAEDVIFSPVHGRLPGVHQHAMALDNLLMLGTSYVRRPPEIRIGPIRFPSWADLPLIGAGAVLFALWQWWRSRAQHEFLVTAMAAWGIPKCLLARGSTRATRVKNIAVWLLALVLTVLNGVIPLALLLAIGWQLFVAFALAPINWLAHIGVFAGVVALVEFRERVDKNHRILLRPRRQPSGVH